MKQYDVAIIGASIAGGSLAARLGQQGLSVALIDRARFPRRKACGEGLSNVALNALVRMGIDVTPAIRSGVAYFGYRLEHKGRSFSFASGRRHLLRGVGVQRLHLDRLILDEAAASNSLSLFLETSVEEIQASPKGHHLELSGGECISARQLVLADGANSVNAARLGIPTHRRQRPLWGISYTLEGNYQKLPTEVAVLLERGFEINCTPVGNLRLNVTFLAEKACVKVLQDPAVMGALLDSAMQKSNFSGAPMGKPLNVGPVNPAKRPYVHDSVMLLGDAAENLDPIAGMGMTHGVLMAEIAAEVLIDHFKEGLPLANAHIRYSNQAAKMSRNYRGFTRLTASLLRSPLRGLLLPIASATVFPELVRRSLDREPRHQTWPMYLPQHFLSLMGS